MTRDIGYGGEVIGEYGDEDERGKILVEFEINTFVLGFRVRSFTEYFFGFVVYVM